LEDEEFQEFLKFGKIEPIENWRCGFKLENFDLPPAATEK